MFSDGRKSQEKFFEDFRLARLSSGNYSVSEIWPEWFPKKQIAPEKEEVDEEDYQNVEWVSPSSGASFEEMMALQRELADNSISVQEPGGEWV